MGGKGVPLILVNGVRIEGFDADRINGAMGKR